MKKPIDKAYQNLGKILFETGIAEAFDIHPDQNMDLNNPGIKALFSFILHNSDESIIYFNDHDIDLISKSSIH